MTLMERINHFTELWQIILPEIKTPSPVCISQWLVYSDAAVEKGILRASKRFAPHRTATPEPEVIYRYVCGVARHEAEVVRV